MGGINNDEPPFVPKADHVFGSRSLRQRQQPGLDFLDKNSDESDQLKERDSTNQFKDRDQFPADGHNRKLG
jgi:hypothetical protein